MTSSKRRVFFALWPDPDIRAALVRATKAIVEQAAGRATPAENLHVTLAFIGELSESELVSVRKISPPRLGRIGLAIDTLGYRKRAQLLWAAPGTVPPALFALEAGLWDRLADIGITRDRRAYLPHVTLARRAHPVKDTLAPVSWPVSEIALVESTLGPPHSTYEILATWPL
jgi:2'-5' RNA ligase